MFKKIKNFPDYLIGRDGSVFSKKTNRIMRPLSHRYHSVGIRNEQGRKRKLVHRLVAEAFLKKKKGHNIVNHKNGIKTDNRVENLEWSTPKKNGRHASVNGLYPDFSGENNNFAKLKKNDIEKIFQLRKKGMTHVQIAKFFPVTREQIGNILRKKSWRKS